MKRIFLAAIAMMVMAQAQAGWVFSYEDQDGFVLAGNVHGTSDGDLVYVTSLSNVTFEGMPFEDLFGGELIFFSDYSSGGLGDGTGLWDVQGILSFSGATMDFLTCTDSDCHDGFIINSDQQMFDSSWGDEEYSPARWSLAVPEPGTLGLLGMGLVGMLARRRRLAA